MGKLIVVKSGPLVGYVAAEIDWERFKKFKGECYAAHVPYLWNGKDRHCGSGTVDFPGLDCSGFARTLLMFAGGGPEEGAFRHLPDGSYTQGEWFRRQGFKQTTPGASALHDGRLRVNVHHADDKDETGHIWLAVNGHTVESFGGHGPGERAWNYRLHSGHTLDQLASLSFVLA